MLHPRDDAQRRLRLYRQWVGLGGRVSRSQWYDVGLAVGALALSASILATMPSWAPGPVAGLLVLAHVAPVAFRRRAPRAAFVVGMGAGALYLIAGWPMVGLGLAALVLTYSLAAYTARRDSLPGLVAVELGLTLQALFGEGRAQFDTLLGNLIICGGVGPGGRRPPTPGGCPGRAGAARPPSGERGAVAHRPASSTTWWPTA